MPPTLSMVYDAGVTNLREVSFVEGFDRAASVERLALEQEDRVTRVQLDDCGHVSGIEGRIPFCSVILRPLENGLRGRRLGVADHPDEKDDSSCRTQRKTGP